MSKKDQDSHEVEKDRISWKQAMVDDVFLLLAAGLVVPTLFYIVWGLMELSNVPVFVPGS